MSDPGHPTAYADVSLQQTVAIEENVALALDTYRVRFGCPEIARRIVPGQFVMLRLHGRSDPLLGRPLALYDTVVDEGGVPRGLDVVYLAKGKFTSQLCRSRPGDPLDVWGPLGNGFPPLPTPHLVMVAGGIGQTPFLALARQFLGQRAYGEPPRVLAGASAHPTSPRVTLCYGARTANMLAGAADFERLGVAVRLSTDDGTRGWHGPVTDLLRRVLDEGGPMQRIVCCGPVAMMQAVAEIAAAAGRPCHVSLETPMACGIGICFTCVAKIRDQQGGWDYRRTCVEGPVFNAADVVW